MALQTIGGKQSLVLSNFTAIPEPTAAAFLAIGAAMLGARRRR